MFNNYCRDLGSVFLVSASYQLQAGFISQIYFPNFEFETLAWSFQPNCTVKIQLMLKVTLRNRALSLKFWLRVFFLKYYCCINKESTESSIQKIRNLFCFPNYSNQTYSFWKESQLFNIGQFKVLNIWLVGITHVCMCIDWNSCLFWEFLQIYFPYWNIFVGIYTQLICHKK